MTEKLKEFKSPGQALKYFLDQREWTQEDLSYILSISLKHTNEIIKDKKPISLEIAKLLENVFDFGAIQWIELGAKYQLQTESKDDREKSVRLKADIYKYMPINELIKKGWIKKTDDLDKEIKTFWNLPKNLELDLSFLDSNKHSLEYRKSEAHEASFNEYNALIWRQMALNFSREMKVKPFNKKGLLKLMNEMHSYTTNDNGIKDFLQDLSNVGVKFVFLSHLSKTYLDGAAFLSSEGEPVVALTGRYDRVDNFWFTLAHELGHVVLHLTNGGSHSIFIDDTTKSKGSRSYSTKEIEANNKAEEILRHDEIVNYFRNKTNYITDDHVEEFAQEKDIHPSIIIGILAYNEMVSYSTMHRFKKSVRDKIPTKYMAEK